MSNKKLTPEEYYETLNKMREMVESCGATWVGVVDKNKPKEVKAAFKKVCEDIEGDENE